MFAVNHAETIATRPVRGVWGHIGSKKGEEAIGRANIGEEVLEMEGIQDLASEHPSDMQDALDVQPGSKPQCLTTCSTPIRWAQTAPA
jgi:hypothetical protein